MVFLQIRVVFYFNSHSLPISDNEKYVIQEQQMADGVISSLTINATVSEDFATYNCTVINAYGMDVKQILLQKKRKCTQLFIILTYLRFHFNIFLKRIFNFVYIICADFLFVYIQIAFRFPLRYGIRDVYK